MRMDRRFIWIAAGLIGTGCGVTSDVSSPNDPSRRTEVTLGNDDDDDDNDNHGGHAKEARTLYIWASDQAGRAPDFLAVIDFDRRSPEYGRVLSTVPLP